MLLSNRPRILTVVLILIVLGSVGVWQSPLFNEPPPPVTIEEATAQLQQNNSQSTQIITNPLATETPVVMQTENNTNNIDPQGEWTISTTDTSFAGYRIGEELLNVGTTTAVGRTNLISGFLMFDGNSILNTYIEVDLTTLKSDESRRDRALQTRGLETNTYPIATFTLTEPISITSLPENNQPVSTDANGILNLHGVSKDVVINLTGTYIDNAVVVVGSAPILLTDYNIEAPLGRRVLSIEDEGVIEFQVVFRKE